MNVARLCVSIALCLLAMSAAAQSPRTEHTLKLDDPDNRPQATLADAAMLVGSWTGTAFGAKFEEVWNPPSAGSMVGLFKLLHEGKVIMYEIMLIKEEEGTLNLKVKHFNPDFSAWEEKEDYVNFPFVKVDEDAIHFAGLSFYRLGDNEMHGYLVMRYDDEIKEEKIIYKRVDAARQP